MSLPITSARPRSDLMGRMQLRCELIGEFCEARGPEVALRRGEQRIQIRVQSLNGVNRSKPRAAGRHKLEIQHELNVQIPPFESAVKQSQQRPQIAAVRPEPGVGWSQPVYYTGRERLCTFGANPSPAPNLTALRSSGLP